QNRARKLLPPAEGSSKAERSPTGNKPSTKWPWPIRNDLPTTYKALTPKAPHTKYLTRSQLLLHRAHNLQALLCLVISNNLLQLRIQRRTIHIRAQTKINISRNITTRITQIMT